MLDTTCPWEARKKEFFADHPKRCRVCRSNRKVQLHRLDAEAIPGTEPDCDLVALCGAHTESAFRYAKKVCNEYDICEAVLIWVRLTKSGKEPGRWAKKASRKPPKTDRQKALKRYTNVPQGRRHGRQYVA